MIAANELRIGNYLLWDNETIFKVNYVLQQGVRFENDHNQFRTNTRCYPIHLTPKILEKCGFRIIKQDVWSAFSEWNRLDIEIILEYWYFRIWHLPWQIECKHLHQLQNLYFALTGEELTIEL